MIISAMATGHIYSNLGDRVSYTCLSLTITITLFSAAVALICCCILLSKKQQQRGALRTVVKVILDNEVIFLTEGAYALLIARGLGPFEDIELFEVLHAIDLKKAKEMK